MNDSETAYLYITTWREHDSNAVHYYATIKFQGERTHVFQKADKPWQKAPVDLFDKALIEKVSPKIQGKNLGLIAPGYSVQTTEQFNSIEEIYPAAKEIFRAEVVRAGAKRLIGALFPEYSGTLAVIDRPGQVIDSIEEKEATCQ